MKYSPVKISVALLLMLGLVQNVFAQSDTIQRTVPGRHNSLAQQKKPYVILISADGLRADFAKKYNATNLLRLGEQGAIAEYMLPSFPSLTFPNHYTIVTGLYPSHHGLVDNTFYDLKKASRYEMSNRAKVGDSSWYGGTPIWVLAEEQKMLSASFYWVGSEAAVKGVRPTYYYNYNDSIPMPRRLAVVKEWLSLPAEQRPHLITLYFPQVDHEAHDYGPESKETEKAVQLIDQAVGDLTTLIAPLHLPVNFVLVSDHGMAQVDVDHPIILPEILRDSTVCKIAIGSTLAHVYMKDVTRIPEMVKLLKESGGDFDVFSGTSAPQAWHYSSDDDPFHRLGDLVLSARYPKVFKTGNRKITPGKHGYDPAMTEMHATFMAWGPKIRKTNSLRPFENIHVYPFIAEILGLRYNYKVDGELKVLKPIIK